MAYVLTKYGGISSMPHLLFYGPPGTGKTSTILAMAKEYYGPSFKSMVIEINASDDRGIDIIKERVHTFCQTTSLFGKAQVKLVILDEADALTGDAQSALRRTMEQYTKNVRFCLCCNYVSKISPALQSRCTRFRFEGVCRGSLKEKALEIVNSEHVNIDTSAIESILDIAKGDARRVINLLQVCHMANTTTEKEIDSNDIYKSAGLPLPDDVDDIVEHLVTKDFKTSFYFLKRVVYDKGYSMADIVTGISNNILKYSDKNKYLRLVQIYSYLSDVEMNLSRGGYQNKPTVIVISRQHPNVIKLRT